jgi:hypothetical protein
MFALQLGHPKINPGPFPPFERVRDAFLPLFRADEESAYLFWHDLPLRLRYRDDLAANFDAILAMAWLVQRDDAGATLVELTTQLLAIRWELRWQGDELSIAGSFRAHEDLYAPYADAFSRASTLAIDRQAFLAEWKTLLHQIIVAFQAGGVSIHDGTERRKWELLQRVERAIARYGVLYLRAEDP